MHLDALLPCLALCYFGAACACTTGGCAHSGCCPHAALPLPLQAANPLAKGRYMRQTNVIDGVSGVLKPGRLTLLLGTPGALCAAWGPGVLGSGTARTWPGQPATLLVRLATGPTPVALVPRLVPHLSLRAQGAASRC